MITREQIEKWVAAKGRWVAFSLEECGAYLKNGEITLYSSFVGQGTDQSVYEKSYEKIIYFTDYLKDFTKDKLTKAEVCDKIEADIKDILHYN